MKEIHSVAVKNLMACLKQSSVADISGDCTKAKQPISKLRDALTELVYLLVINP